MGHVTGLGEEEGMDFGEAGPGGDVGIPAASHHVEDAGRASTRSRQGFRSSLLLVHLLKIVNDLLIAERSVWLVLAE